MRATLTYSRSGITVLGKAVTADHPTFSPSAHRALHCINFLELHVQHGGSLGLGLFCATDPRKLVSHGWRFWSLDWWKGYVEAELASFPLDNAICAHTIASEEGVLGEMYRQLLVSGALALSFCSLSDNARSFSCKMQFDSAQITCEAAVQQAFMH